MLSSPAQSDKKSVTQSDNYLSFATFCRSAGWPWGQFGVAEEATPKKNKTTGRRKRSSSPASRTTSHKSAAEAVPEGEVSQAPPKRAKRAAGIGAPKVVKRGPGRRGDTYSHILTHQYLFFFWLFAYRVANC